MIDALLKAATRAGLDENQIMQIAKTKYAKIDLRMDPQFTKRETFQISDEITELTKKSMLDFGNHNLPPKIKDKLEDFVAKAIAFGDDQQTLRHTNAFLKFADDVFGPGGSSNVTSMVPDQLARQAHKQSVQAADSTYGDFPGRQEMIKKNIQRMIQERPGEVEVLRNYLNSGYDGTYAEYLKNEVDSEKWMNYMNVFPEGYGAGDFALGGRVGYAGGGAIAKWIKNLLAAGEGKGVGSLMKAKTRESLIPPGRMQEAGVHQRMMQEPGWYRDRILGESKMDEAMLNLGEATKHRTGWQPDPLNPVVAKRHREAFASPKEEGIMQVSKIDDEVQEMLTDMRAMKDKSKTMMTEAEFKLGEMNAKDALVDDMVREMDEGVHPRVALQRFLAAYNKLVRPQHATGGRVGMWGGGLLKKMMGTALNPKRERQLLEPKLNLGQNPAAIGDMEQIKNIIRNPNTELEAIHELEDMIQNATRYTDQQKQLFLRLIKKEKIRANVLWDNPKAQKMADEDPEGFDAWLEQMLREDQGAGDYAAGGRVGFKYGGIKGGDTDLKNMTSDDVRGWGWNDFGKPGYVGELFDRPMDSDFPDFTPTLMSGVIENLVEQEFKKGSKKHSPQDLDDYESIKKLFTSKFKNTDPRSGRSLMHDSIDTGDWAQNRFILPSGRGEETTHYMDRPPTFKDIQLKGPQTSRIDPFQKGGRVGLHEGGVLGSMGVADGSYQKAIQAAQPFSQFQDLWNQPGETSVDPGFVANRTPRFTQNPDPTSGDPDPNMRRVPTGPPGTLAYQLVPKNNLPSYMPGNGGGPFNSTANIAPPMSGPGTIGSWTQPESNSFTGGGKDSFQHAIHSLSEEHDSLGREIQQIGQQPLSQQSQQQNSISPNNPYQNVLSGFGGGIGNLFGARS